MLSVTLSHPWLDADLGREKQVLSWAVHQPGLVRARHVSWREVRDADLTPELDARDWLTREVQTTGRTDHVAMITSRAVSAHVVRSAEVGGMSASCLATVGLSNTVRVGATPTTPKPHWGTVNLLVDIDAGLTEAAQIEALSIATEARTAAILEAGLTVSGGAATGTGTDCIAVACDRGETRYAGLHTALGQAVGQAVFDAVSEGVINWLAERHIEERHYG